MFRIKNWSSFQSYKDRQPPWIRLHKNLLDDFAFQRMGAEARAMLPMLWLMASEDSDPTSGMLRFGYDTVAFRLRIPEKTVKSAMAEIIKSGFITEEKTTSYESVTESLRNCHSETETEAYSKETEAETESILSDFESLWKIYPRKDGSKSEARKSYLKSLKSGAEHGQIESGVRAYADSVSGKEQKYTAHFTTWLNGRRWESDYSQSNKPAEYKSEWLSAADAYIAKHSQPREQE